MLKPLLAHVALSQLIMIDVQTKLVSVMPSDEMQPVLSNCQRLATASHLLQVPMLITEQYPAGLGATAKLLLEAAPLVTPIEKVTFSCMATPQFRAQLQPEKSQIILAGMEAHICILQTALDILHTGRQVFVVEDAVISRTLANKQNAMARLRDAGCVVASTESILFEWLGVAQGSAFKTISQLIK